MGSGLRGEARVSLEIGANDIYFQSPDVEDGERVTGACDQGCENQGLLGARAG